MSGAAARQLPVNSFFLAPVRLSPDRAPETSFFIMKGLILAQNERWRRGLGMQVERESGRKAASRVAKGRVMLG